MSHYGHVPQPIGLRGGLRIELRAARRDVCAGAAHGLAKMLRAVEGTPQKSVVLQEAMGLLNLEHFRRGYRTPLSQAGWLVRTDPGSPNSPQQRYRLTPKGQAWLDRFNTLPKP